MGVINSTCYLSLTTLQVWPTVCANQTLYKYTEVMLQTGQGWETPREEQDIAESNKMKTTVCVFLIGLFQLSTAVTVTVRCMECPSFILFLYFWQEGIYTWAVVLFLLGLLFIFTVHINVAFRHFKFCVVLSSIVLMWMANAQVRSCSEAKLEAE